MKIIGMDDLNIIKGKNILIVEDIIGNLAFLNHFWVKSRPSSQSHTDPTNNTNFAEFESIFVNTVINIMI